MFYWNLLYYEIAKKQDLNIVESFNPCFIGTYSITFPDVHENIPLRRCFNPCFIGTYSITDIARVRLVQSSGVLILVLLELTLLPYVFLYLLLDFIFVLILVLLELTLLHD